MMSYSLFASTATTAGPDIFFDRRRVTQVVQHNPKSPWDQIVWGINDQSDECATSSNVPRHVVFTEAVSGSVKAAKWTFTSSDTPIRLTLVDPAVGNNAEQSEFNLVPEETTEAMARRFDIHFASRMAADIEYVDTDVPLL